MFQFPGYDITEIIHRGKKSTLFRAKKVPENIRVIIKTLSSEYPARSDLIRLRHEYEIAKDLGMQGAVKPLELIKSEGRLALVFEDVKGLPLKELLPGRKVCLEEFFIVAIQLVEFLGQLHQAKIIHKSLNPYHIIIEPESNEVKLSGFDMATHLPREEPGAVGLEIGASRLAYVSPEQTGRMNRMLDYRTDFYSLGVTLYEMLTGTVPFPSVDALELLHCHMAKTPQPPHEVSKEVPRVVSDIIMKLMAKTAEERYQSARGLQSDLEECHRQYREKGRIDTFVIGKNDVCEQLRIAQGLYSREPETRILVGLYDQVSQGRTGTVMVSGYAGVGKTSLVMELRRTISENRGYFLCGKFDQFKRNIPHSAVISAFQDLVRELLTESKSRLNEWKARLTEALGQNAQIIIEVIPEMELIIGPQPPVYDLGPVETQNRFNRVFRNFIRVFCKKEHPLVVFLDDLQWVDTATLRLITLMMTDSDTEYLLLIGAYRDNEVAVSHPLASALEGLEKEGASITRVMLEPLTADHVALLTADSINAAPESIRPLAALVTQKTNGNPFFVNQFLTTLYEQGLLVYDSDSKQWHWHLSKIKDADITENVVDLLIHRLERLSPQIRNLLRLAACIGIRFDLATLGLITQKNHQEIFSTLLPALEDGLIFPISDGRPASGVDLGTPVETLLFAFQHNRVQEAAYSLTEGEDPKSVHLKIGRLLLQKLPQDILEEKIFEVLDQLNRAAGLISDQREMDELIDLNLRAGRKARAAAAYDPAFEYLALGLDLMGPNGWHRCYEKALVLHQTAAEAACLSGRFEQVENLADTIIQKGRSTLDMVSAYQCRIWGRIAQNQPRAALETCLEVLHLLGVDLKEYGCEQEARKALLEPLRHLGAREIEDLIELPQMSDPIQQATLQILVETNSASYIARSKLLTSVNLNEIFTLLKYGHTPLAPFFYTTYAAMLCWMGDNIDAGYRFGRLGLKLLDRLKAQVIRSRAIYCFNVHVRHFKEPLKETLTPLLEGYEAGLESGDLLYAAFNACFYCLYSFLLGQPLAEMEEKMVRYNEAIGKTNNRLALAWLEPGQQAVQNLLGQTDDFCQLTGDVIDERTWLPHYQISQNNTALYMFHFHKLLLCYLFENYEEASIQAATAKMYLDEVAAMVYFTVFHFYDSLVHLKVCESCSIEERKQRLESVAANQEKMKHWADHAPMNHLHKYLLVEAERMRVLGRDLEAIEHYQRAVQLAKTNHYIQEEALAHELAARFWHGRGNEDFAGVCLRKAYRCYLRWGATGKIESMKQKYASWLPQEPQASMPFQETSRSPDTSGVPPTMAGFDMATMMKASQAISGQIELDRLLSTFMNIIMENVGAQTGFLVLMSNQSLKVEAKGSVHQGEILLRPPQPLEETQTISTAIVNYVVRTGQSVVLNEAADDARFSQDRYIQEYKPRSVLCVPIVYQSELKGVIYLENNLISGAFTPNRIEVLKLLAPQIAISIVNATLYSNLKQTEEKYRSIFENAVEGIYQTSPGGRFISANPALARMFGFDSPQELIESITDIEHQLFVNPERRDRFLALMNERQAVSGFEVEFFRQNKTRFWAALHARPVYDRDGEMLFIEGMVADITDQKKALEALREREEYLLKENIRLRSNIKDRFRFANIIGKSAAMQQVYELILKAAATEVNVIIYGESGTGKELVARAIHDMSERKSAMFVPVNSGAIPEYLMESEFFGYKKGAFTGAHADKHGYLDVADGGTLFLDELGDIDISIQAKLLRAIEGGGYTPVGGTRIKHSDMRIIAASNKDLSEQVRSGLMREDFYYRIHVIPIHLPPLRERKEDIPLLVDHCMAVSNYGEKLAPLAGHVLEALMNYDWPGNVRELQNTIHRYATLGRLDFLGSPATKNKDPGLQPDLLPEAGDQDLQTAVAEFEKRYLAKMLDRYCWHRGKVAAALGLNRKTLFRKMQRFALGASRPSDKKCP